VCSCTVKRINLWKGKNALNKKIFVPITVIALAGAGAMVTKLLQPDIAEAATNNGRITVNGMGEVRVQPDIAYVSIGYTNQHTDSRTAQSSNSTQMEQIIAAVRSMGIPENDIQTIQFNIFPQYDHANNNRITGYTVTNKVQIIVRDITRTGEIVDRAVSEGANAGGNIQFSIADSGPYYEEAMEQAIRHAQSKADAIGKSLQVSISRPREVIEVGGNFAPIGFGGAMALRAESAMPVQAGELTVRADIQVVFEY